MLPAKLSDLDQDAIRLYEMIWRQFLACQMAAAQFTSTKITVKAGSEFELLAKGRIIRFDGYTIVQPNKRKNEELIELPDLGAGDELKLSSLEPQQHFTKPPPRYSEAALVKELEKRLFHYFYQIINFSSPQLQTHCLVFQSQLKILPEQEIGI